MNNLKRQCKTTRELTVTVTVSSLHRSQFFSSFHSISTSVTNSELQYIRPLKYSTICRLYRFHIHIYIYILVVVVAVGAHEERDYAHAEKEKNKNTYL